jgi:hypothetical protein
MLDAAWIAVVDFIDAGPAVDPDEISEAARDIYA